MNKKVFAFIVIIALVVLSSFVIAGIIKPESKSSFSKEQSYKVTDDPQDNNLLSKHISFSIPDNWYISTEGEEHIYVNPIDEKLSLQISMYLKKRTQFYKEGESIDVIPERSLGLVKNLRKITIAGRDAISFDVAYEGIRQKYFLKYKGKLLQISFVSRQDGVIEENQQLLNNFIQSVQLQ